MTLKENHELIQGGPYRFVRHPIYTGILLAILGTVVALTPSVGGLVCIVMVTIGFNMKRLHEEKLMLQQFPEAYPAYQKRVRAIIPFIW